MRDLYCVFGYLLVSYSQLFSLFIEVTLRKS
nr:MAG TPA: hypothetical protein [Caudoviricetes sp.]